MTDEQHTNRRSFMRTSAIMSAAAAGVAALGAGRAQASTPITTAGDIAILQFLCAAEQLESDLWGQYAQIGQTNAAYAAALQLNLDPDTVVYATDTSADEHSHAAFIAAALTALGVTPVDLTPFKTIPGPNVPGSKGTLNVTNLTNLTLDTSYYTRYHDGLNPDLGQVPPQIAQIAGQSAIPTTPGQKAADLVGTAGVAGLHFASIEQGGSSLYVTLLQQVSSVKVLRVVASIYATEAVAFCHLQRNPGELPGLQ